MSCTTNTCGDWEDGQETPTGQCSPRRLKKSCDVPLLYTNEAQSASDTCPEGTVGEVISVTIDAGTINNPFSVAAANAEALALAEARVATLRALSPCLYPNTEQVCTETCPEGTVGDPITVTIAAGEYTAESQEEADALALAAACEQASLLRAETPCYWVNEEQECTETCPEGLTGDPITVTVEAGEYISYVSQEDADAQALAAACAEAAELRTASPCVAEEVQGSLWAWGYNGDRGLGVGDASDRLMPVIAGEDFPPEITWIKIGGHDTVSVGLKSNGTLWIWGTDYEGELGQGNVANGYFLPFPTQVGVATNWTDFAVGQEHVIAINSDGDAYTWGYNWVGQLGQGDLANRTAPTLVVGMTGCAQVACGEYTTYVLKDNGTLWATGRGNLGQLGNGGADATSTFEQIGSASNWTIVRAALTSACALNDAGEVWSWGNFPNDLDPPSKVSGVHVFDELSMGDNYIIARKEGTLWGIGNNSQGQLGIGSLTNAASFTQIGVDNTWTKFEAGFNFVLALKEEGSLWGWGGDNYGNLGQASVANDRQVPIQIGPDNLWVGLGVGYSPSFGLRSVVTAPPPPAGISGVALGGSVTIDGGYHIHRFDYNTNFEVVDGVGVLFDFILVGGGAGGGGFGGGSAGRLISQTGVSLANGVYPVTVGARGLGQGGGNQGTDGVASTFNGNTAEGGVGGGAYNTTSARNGKAGHNGSGAGNDWPTNLNGTGGVGTSGNNGGDSATNAGTSDGSGGGGAGNGGDGANGSGGNGGNGGAGTSSSITGSAVNYAGGGAGGGTDAGGTGGSGAGGDGAKGNVPAVDGGTGKTPGSGGGGGAGNTPPNPGDGARGCFIIRYLSPP